MFWIFIDFGKFLVLFGFFGGFEKGVDASFRWHDGVGLVRG